MGQFVLMSPNEEIPCLQVFNSSDVLLFVAVDLQCEYAEHGAGHAGVHGDGRALPQHPARRQPRLLLQLSLGSLVREGSIYLW